MVLVVRDASWIPRSERSPGGGNGNPLQYSRLEDPMDRGAWWATVHGVAKSRTRLSDLTHGHQLCFIRGGLSIPITAFIFKQVPPGGGAVQSACCKRTADWRPRLAAEP